MASIFGDATLVIVAGSTPHPSSPLLFSSLQIHGGTKTHYDMFAINKRTLRSKNPAYDALMRDLSNSNYYIRAWMLQELMLARSSIHFVSGKAIFEDSTGLIPLVPETPADRLQLLPHPDNHPKKLYMSLFANSALPADILELWWLVVEQYSFRKVTFHSDKLIAISGLVNNFAGALGPYAAGLWPQYDFVRSLCWQPRSTSVSSSAYVAPSWSWAALDGAIIAPTEKQASVCAEVIKWECIPLGENQLGAVRRAELVLRAPCAELEVRGQDNTHGKSSGISQCLIYAQKDSMSLTFELDTFRTFPYGEKMACLKILEDIDGDLTCMVVARASYERWERVAVIQMQRRRGEHRWFGSATEREFVIV